MSGSKFEGVLIRFIILALNEDVRSNPLVRLLYAINVVTQTAITTIGITIQGTIDATASSKRTKQSLAFTWGEVMLDDIGATTTLHARGRRFVKGTRTSSFSSDDSDGNENVIPNITTRLC